MSFPIFLKKSKEASVSAPVESVERKPDNEPEFDSLHAAAEDLKAAVAAGDVPGIASALRAAFQILESEEQGEA